MTEKKSDEELLEIARKALVEGRETWTGAALAYCHFVYDNGKVTTLSGGNPAGLACHASCKDAVNEADVRFVTSVYFDRKTMTNTYSKQGELTEEEEKRWIAHILSIPHIQGVIANPDVEEIYHTGIVVNANKVAYSQLLFACKALRMHAEDPFMVKLWNDLTFKHDVHPMFAHYASQFVHKASKDALTTRANTHATHMGYCLKEKDFLQLLVTEPPKFTEFRYSYGDTRRDSTNKLIISNGVGYHSPEYLGAHLKGKYVSVPDGWGGTKNVYQLSVADVADFMKALYEKVISIDQPKIAEAA